MVKATPGNPRNEECHTYNSKPEVIAQCYIDINGQKQFQNPDLLMKLDFKVKIKKGDTLNKILAKALRQEFKGKQISEKPMEEAKILSGFLAQNHKKHGFNINQIEIGDVLTIKKGKLTIFNEKEGKKSYRIEKARLLAEKKEVKKKTNSNLEDLKKSVDAGRKDLLKVQYLKSLSSELKHLNKKFLKTADGRYGFENIRTEEKSIYILDQNSPRTINMFVDGKYKKSLNEGELGPKTQEAINELSTYLSKGQPGGHVPSGQPSGEPPKRGDGLAGKLIENAKKIDTSPLEVPEPEFSMLSDDGFIEVGVPINIAREKGLEDIEVPSAGDSETEVRLEPLPKKGAGKTVPRRKVRNPRKRQAKRKGPADVLKAIEPKPGKSTEETILAAEKQEAQRLAVEKQEAARLAAEKGIERKRAEETKKETTVKLPTPNNQGPTTVKLPTSNIQKKTIVVDSERKPEASSFDKAKKTRQDILSRLKSLSSEGVKLNGKQFSFSVEKKDTESVERVVKERVVNLFLGNKKIGIMEFDRAKPSSLSFIHEGGKSKELVLPLGKKADQQSVIKQGVLFLDMQEKQVEKNYKAAIKARGEIEKSPIMKKIGLSIHEVSDTEWELKVEFDKGKKVKLGLLTYNKAISRFTLLDKGLYGIQNSRSLAIAINKVYLLELKGKQERALRREFRVAMNEKHPQLKAQILNKLKKINIGKRQGERVTYSKVFNILYKQYAKLSEEERATWVKNFKIDSIKF